MRNAPNKVILTPRTADIASSVAADWLWFKLHADPGTYTDLVNSSGKVFTAAQTITNATATDWSAVATRFTPGAGSGGSTRYVRWHDDVSAANAAIAKAFFAPHAAGSHVFLWDHIQTRDPAGAEFLFGASPNLQATGGYAIRLSVTGQIQCAYRALGSVLLETKAQFDLGTMPVARTSVMAVFDWANMQTYIYTNGVQRHSAVLTGTLPTLDTANATSGGIVLFANAGSGATQHLNGPSDATHSGTSVSDMLVVRNTVDRAADFAALALQHYQYPREVPSVLRGW